MPAKKNVILIDPELSYRRHLHYQERHSGWHIFRAIYWGIYLFILGVLLTTVVPNTLSYTGFLGWAFILLSFFVVVYGFAASLHLKLMKKYA